jgi:uncharacterized protein (DUF1015 family)
MPRFEPFVGLRYTPEIPLELVVAPPYDVVGPEERASLAHRHHANAIHVELPKPDEARGLDRYTHAAQLLGAWISDGTLRREAGPAFYAYRMTSPGSAVTTGVIGALGIEAEGGDVLPHEQTIPKDTTDRLDLLRACRANLSPIWGLSLSAGFTTTFSSSLSAPPDEAAIDDDGIRHELWIIRDPERVDAVRTAVAGAPVVLADGHHRYETARTYRGERPDSTAPGSGPGVSGAGGVMALVVELVDDQVSVGPIHRTVTGLATGTDVVQGFSHWFELDPSGTDETAIAALVGERASGLVHDGRVWRLTGRPEAYAEAASDLDSSLVAAAVHSMGGSTQHHHTWPEAVDAARSGAADAAVVLRPVTVDQIAAWARDRRRMPPKSTYFHPKPRTGMVIRPLDP